MLKTIQDPSLPIQSKNELFKFPNNQSKIGRRQKNRKLQNVEDQKKLKSTFGAFNLLISSIE